MIDDSLQEYLTKLNQAIDNLEAKSDRQVYSPLAREEAKNQLDQTLKHFIEVLYQEAFNRGNRKAKDEINLVSKIEKYQIKKELTSRVKNELKREMKNESALEKGVQREEVQL
jgi:hypothetical protein